METLMIFFDNLSDRIESTNVKFVDNNKLGQCVDLLEDRNALQRDLDRLGLFSLEKRRLGVILLLSATT